MSRALICLLSLLIAGTLRAQTPDAADMQQLRTQATQWEWSPDNGNHADPWSGVDWANRYKSSLQPDGSWADIDYKDQSRGFWKTAEHLKRTLAIATIGAQLKSNGLPYLDKQHAALLAAHYWIIHDFRNPNWWHNQINVPGQMARLLLLIGNTMDPADKAAALKIVDRATFSMTGQNRVWMAGIIFRKALVEDDPALALQARNTILAEVSISQQEGLQADWSFQQHGPQQQMGNYGSAFATEMAGWAHLWQGTALALPDAKLALLRNFLVKGEAIMVANDAMDINGCGRQLFPHSPFEKGMTIHALLMMMQKTDSAHAQQYASAWQEGAQPRGAGTTANWNFFRSETMVHRRPGFYASVKLCSNRVIGEELVNGENLRGRYLADGATFLYQDSTEYTDIFPVWDWRRIPGVTCMASGTTLTPAGKMSTDFAGGATDGTYGVEGLDYHRDGVTARKAWFFLDEGVVCLGAGITGTNVQTSVDQRLANGIPTAPSGPLPDGVHLYNAATWLLEGSEGYLFQQPANVWAGTQPQTGSWSTVYTAGKPTPVTKNIFSIWIDHPPQSSTYAYTLLPGMTVEKMQTYAAKPPVEILSNTPDLQAIRDTATGLVEVLFYKPGDLKAQNLSISAKGPCAAIIRAGAINVADPTEKQLALTLTINGRTRSIPPPHGEAAGSTCGW